MHGMSVQREQNLEKPAGSAPWRNLMNGSKSKYVQIWSNRNAKGEFDVESMVFEFGDCSWVFAAYWIQFLKAGARLSIVSCRGFREWQIHVLKQHHFALAKHCVAASSRIWCPLVQNAEGVYDQWNRWFAAWQRNIGRERLPFLLKRQLLCNVVISRGPAQFAICMNSTESPWWQEFVGCI